MGAEDLVMVISVSAFQKHVRPALLRIFDEHYPGWFPDTIVVRELNRSWVGHWAVDAVVMEHGALRHHGAQLW